MSEVKDPHGLVDALYRGKEKLGKRCRELLEENESLKRHNEELCFQNKELREHVDGIEDLARTKEAYEDSYSESLVSLDKQRREIKELIQENMNGRELLDSRSNEIDELEKTIDSSYKARKKLLTHSAEQSILIKSLKKENEELKKECRKLRHVSGLIKENEELSKQLKEAKEQYRTLELRCVRLALEKRGLLEKVEVKDKKESKVEDRFTSLEDRLLALDLRIEKLR